MHVSILIPNGGAIISSIVGPYEILDFVNQQINQNSLTALTAYEIDFVGLDSNVAFHQGMFCIHPTKTLDQVDKTDLIIITTPYGDMATEITNNQEFFPWIRKMHLEEGAEVASLCIGAFLLAATGLMQNKACTTHWSAVPEFKQLYPEIELLPEKILVDDAGIYSSGGSYSYLNLMLYLIQRYNGYEMAKLVSKVFEIDMRRQSQKPFIIFQGQRSHDDQIVKKIQDYLEKHYDKKLSLDELSARFHISKRNLIRRFKRATSNTPIQYLQRVKVEAAKRELENTEQSITEIMLEAGYNDIKSFRQTFKKFSGLSPSEYRTRYSRISALS